MSCLQSTDDGSGHDTSAFPFDLDDEGETPSGAAEAEMWAEELLNDSALLVVKRGRNVESTHHHCRATSWQRHLPRRRHRQPPARGVAVGEGRFCIVDVGSLNGPTSTGNRRNRRCWSTATKCNSASFA